MYSFAFQQAFRRGIRAEDQLIVDKVILYIDSISSTTNRMRPQCYESAKAVIASMLDSLAPSGFERYAPDSKLSIASAYLI